MIINFDREQMFLEMLHEKNILIIQLNNKLSGAEKHIEELAKKVTKNNQK